MIKIGYFELNKSQTASPRTPGSMISAHSWAHRIQRFSERASSRDSLRRDVVRRDRSPDGNPRIARTISSLPLRSAMRMVAELMPFVDCSSLFRSEGGTSSTDRYTSVLFPMEIKMVELFNVTRDMATFNLQPESRRFPIASAAFAANSRSPHVLILPE